MPRCAAIVLLCLCTALPSTPQTSAQASPNPKPTTKKKPAKKSKKKVRAPRVHHYAQPRVSAKVRTASLQKVALQLDERPDPVIDRPGTLVPFFERLYRLSIGDNPTVHILHFGDSHTASDDWTGVLRDLFQNRFGNGGAGFSLAGIPFKGYRRFDVHGGASKAWDPAGLRTGEGDGLFGLGGVSISTDRIGQTIYLDADCASVELDYLQQPGGGRVALSDNGATVNESSTEGSLAPGFLAYATSPGRHRITLEKQKTGVVYDSIGLNGASVSVPALIFNESHWAEELRHRNPDLVILNYGTNESSFAAFLTREYEIELREAIRRLRAALPNASILVMSPMDRGQKNGGEIETLPTIPRIVDIQRRVAAELHCGFFNTFEVMGGAGTMSRWYDSQPRLFSADFIHPTPAGARLVAQAFVKELIAGLNRYKLRQVLARDATAEVP